MTTITIDQVSKFLLGEAPLDGAWFGDKHPSKRGAFWWREYLRAALAAQPSQPAHTEAQRGEPDFYPHGIAHLAPPLDINSNQIAQLWALVEAGNEDVDDPTVFRLQHKLPGKDTDGEPAPGGLYVWVAEYPEEGMIFLDPDSAPQPELTTDAAVKRLCDALREDLDYAWSWHCNIAMTAFDAGGSHDVANEGAARFLQLLAGVDTRKHQQFARTQEHPMRNDAATQSEPAWHDAPTEPGDWILSTACGLEVHQGIKQHELDNGELWPGSRWFGPIPEDQK